MDDEFHADILHEENINEAPIGDNAEGLVERNRLINIYYE